MKIIDGGFYFRRVISNARYDNQPDMDIYY